MTIVKNETVKFSEEEEKAISIVERIVENLHLHATDPKLVQAAKELDEKMTEFFYYWRE